MSEREVVVLSGVRTAIADFGGSLKDIPPTELAGQVVADGEELQPVLREDFPSTPGIGLVLGAARDVQVVPPAGQFEAVVAPFGRHGSKLGEGDVRELSSEECDRSFHDNLRLL